MKSTDFRAATLFGGQADGVVDCISKPFRVRDMLARVHLQLQLGKRRVRLEEDFEVRSHELQVLTDLSPVSRQLQMADAIKQLLISRLEYLERMPMASK
jgi:DNA-binding response OmpR family regulator